MKKLSLEQVARKVGFNFKEYWEYQWYGCVFGQVVSAIFPSIRYLLYYLNSIWAGCMWHLVLVVEVWQHIIKKYNEVDVSHNLIQVATSRFDSDVIYNSGYVIPQYTVHGGLKTVVHDKNSLWVILHCIYYQITSIINRKWAALHMFCGIISWINRE